MAKLSSEMASRTIRLHVPTYNSILKYFRNSPSGLHGADAIRQLLIEFGHYCERQMRANQVASSKDLQAAEAMVTKILSEEQAASERPHNG